MVQESRLCDQTLSGHLFDETDLVELHCKRISNEVLSLASCLGYSDEAVIGIASQVIIIWRNFGVRYWTYDTLDFVLRIFCLDNDGLESEHKDYAAFMGAIGATLFCVDRAVIHSSRGHVGIAEQWLSCASELSFFKLRNSYSFMSQMGKSGADAKHGKPGGSWEKQAAIRAAWASGKFDSRDICAEQECASLGMSFSSARKALRGTPDAS